MLPIVFEWHWEYGRLIFMGITYIVICIIAGGLFTAYRRTKKNMGDNEAAS